MRTTREALGLLLAILIASAGCTSTDAHLKPPKPPVEYTVPPDETRYSKAPEFPKETMDQDFLLKKAKDASKPGSLNNPGSSFGGRGAGGFNGN